MANSAEKQGLGPIVSSSHLAAGAMPALSEMEFALTVAQNAFARWMVRCMDAAGLTGLTPLEVLVLHSAHHRERAKTLGDLCTVLNIEDTHLVSYAVKKLVKLGLVESGKRGKEKTVAATKAGREACETYKQVREKLLVSSIVEMGLNEEEVSRVAGLLRAISGQYDQAARGAASL
ncbi:MAG: winged helix DNA-binding protein [Pseudomonadota bacterium]